jgi:hypothetical protein
MPLDGEIKKSPQPAGIFIFLLSCTRMKNALSTMAPSALVELRRFLIF